MADKKTLRIAAVADIHVKKNSAGTFQPMFTEITESADVLLLCGDLTDYGTADEAKVHTLARAVDALAASQR